MDAATFKPSPEICDRLRALIQHAYDIGSEAAAQLDEWKIAYPGSPEDGNSRYPVGEPVDLPEPIRGRAARWVQDVEALPEAERLFIDFAGHDYAWMKRGNEGHAFPCLTFLPLMMRGLADVIKLMAEETEPDFLQRHFYLAAMDFAGHAITVCLRDEESGIGADIRDDVEVNLGLTFNPLAPEDYAALAESRGRLQDIFRALSREQIAVMDSFATRHQQSGDTLLPEVQGEVRIQRLMDALARANAPATVETTQAAYLLAVSAMEKWPEFRRPSVLKQEI
jgi:hypothetical protein